MIEDKKMTMTNVNALIWGRWGDTCKKMNRKDKFKID